LEVVERDCLWRLRDGGACYGEEVDFALLAGSAAQARVRDMLAAGIEIMLRDITGPTGLPCMLARLSHSATPPLVGLGCHLAPQVAAVRALAEAAQARLAWISGARDDILEAHYALHPALIVPEGPIRTGRAMPKPPIAAPSWSERIAAVAARITTVTGMPPLAVDLRRPEFGVPVVHVVAPGLFHRRNQ
jgi:ribosomal protein S12 methylthiotransferase accessory factor